MHSDTNLYDQLNKTLIDIEKQITILQQRSEQRGVNWLALTLADGKMPATDLLVAKSHVLQAMAAIKVGAKKR